MSQATNHSLSLNGTSAYMSVPNSTSINISGPITVEAWIKVNAITANYQEIVYRHSWQVPGTGGGYEFTITNTGKVRLDLYQSHNTYTTCIGSTTITTGTWHHVAGVFDGNQMRVYLNGVLDGSLWTTNAPASGNSPLKIGWNSGGTYYFGGLIDNVRISAAALYTSNFTPGLGTANQTRALWKFNGQTTSDLSGNSNDGTLQGGATYSTDVPSANNSSPTVSLTHPQNNTAFAAGSTVVLDATATDSDGVVSKVEFYQGTTLLGTDTSAPYMLAWNNVPSGVYSMTAKASDDSGAVTTSSTITVNVLDSATQHSLSLNGTSAYMSVPNSTSINISGPITVEAWIKVNAITANYQEIVYRHSWQVPGTGGGYEFSITNTGKVRLDLYQSHNQYTTAIGSTTITTNTWHHVAGVFDGSQMRVYLNGVLDGSLWTTNGPASGNSPLKIGWNTGGTYYFGGLIDEVRISAVALYSSNFTPGLGPANQTRAYWKFDGQTTNDSSGNGNHGTLQGSATYSTSVPVQGSSQRPVPAANGPYNGLTAQPVQFSSSGSSDADGTIVSYHWNFGDGTSSNTANPTHTYIGAGSYVATLTVTDNGGLLASATSSVTIGSSANSRLDPLNATGGGGENSLSQNFNWTVPLVSLRGRAGLDLNIPLSYNSLVWTRAGNYMLFDHDKGFPGPGFRLGFPVIQQLHFNSETGKYAYLLISPDGSRTELRQVGNSVLFESADSAYLLLDTTDMTLRTSDGMQLSYTATSDQFHCTKIQDRNGNYITIDYVSNRLDQVIDTLGRQIKFNYDGAGLLTSITQTWNQGQPNQTDHPWTEFAYTDTTIQTNFPGLTVSGPANNTTIKTLSKVTLPDDSHFDFSYTTWGQVWKVAYVAADNPTHVLNYRAYNLPGSPLQATSPQSDCPRFTERRDWVKYWNGDTDGTIASNEEAITSFSGPVSDTWIMPGDSQSVSGIRTQVMLPDGTIDKIYFLGTAGTQSGWSRGLPALVETRSGGNWQRKVKTTWTQDNPSVSYPQNPRVLETNVYDLAGNRARTEIVYEQFTFANNLSCSLRRDVKEYAADELTVLRTTRINYNTSSSYTDRRILGLPSEKLIYDGTVSGTLMAKVEFFYDETGSIQGSDAPIQHNNPSYVVGRGNLSSVKRYNVDNLSQFTTTSTKYNPAGAVLSAKDASNHEVQISYADSFSDGNNSRNTLAYPTTLTNPDGYTTTSKYNFDFGAATYARTPQPNDTINNPGPESTFTFDSIGRLQQITNLVNNAYTRFVYVGSQLKVETYTTIQDGLSESPSFRITDGAGRVIASATDHPGSTGGFSGQRIVYDVMGRVFKMSNPTETSASGTPFQWNAAGDDATAGWIYSEQTYDWKGRPLVTTNPSVTSNPAETTTVTASYSGCGCAGGEVVTLTDEGTKVGTSIKKRQQKIYTDVLGRVVKTEVLNWDGSGPNGTNGTIYTTTATNYNVRNQVTLIREFAGTTSSSNYHDTTMSYDGFGRLKTQHLPEQKVDPNNSASSDHTTWNYNSDDTVQSVADARGVITNFSYNARHLVTGISYDASNVPAGANIAATASTTFTYDAAGNRKSMSDGSGTAIYNYDQLSRMDWEERTFTGLPTAGSFRLSYEYNLSGVLKKVTDERADTSFTWTQDRTGRVTAVNAVGAQGAQMQFASQILYRAGGQLKSRSDANTTVSFDYNNRGLVKSYSVTNSVNSSVSDSYTYHPDGMIKLAQNGDPIKDRAYSYDVAQRLQSAYSGVEARNYANDTSGGTPDGPYLHSYTYDHWNNQTDVDSRFWTREADVFLSFDANNRVSGWSYDAEGNVLSRNETGTFPPFEPGRFSYDAAGQEIGSTQKRSTFIIEEGTGYTITNDFVNTRVHDGDGQVVDYSVLRHLYVNTHFSTTFGGRVFLLRSTVLGGKTISEYDANAAWSTTHVFAGSERIGQVNASGPASVWHNFDPVTGDLLSTISNGSLWDRTTLDPGGADVGDSDPFPPDGTADPDGLVSENPAGGKMGILGAGGGRSNCVLDGIEVDCSFIRGETSVQCPANDCGPKWNPEATSPDNRRGAFEYFHAFVNGFAGYMTQYGRYRYESGNIGGSQFMNSPLDEIPTDALDQTIPQQQKRIPFLRLPLLNHKKLLQETLDYSDCNQFMAQLISKAGELSEKNDPVSTDIMTLYGMVNGQARGGFRLNHEGELYGYGFKGLEKLEQIGGGGGASWGSWGASNVTIWINEQKKPEDASAREIARTPFQYAQRSLEELVHVAGKNRTYTEVEINSAANAQEQGLNFIQAIKKHCIPREMW